MTTHLKVHFNGIVAHVCCQKHGMRKHMHVRCDNSTCSWILWPVSFTGKVFNLACDCPVGALDRQTGMALAALGIPGFQMFLGTTGPTSLPTRAQCLPHNLSRLACMSAGGKLDDAKRLNAVSRDCQGAGSPFLARISTIEAKMSCLSSSVWG